MHDNVNPYSKKISLFWKNSFQKVMNSRFNMKMIRLPLARIKRLMRIEEDVRVMAAEVPVLFSFATEIFIEELTLRAWMNTEDDKRKILQASDIAFAAKTSSMYDFLVHILPSGDIEHKNTNGQVQFLDQYPFQDRVNQYNKL